MKTKKIAAKKATKKASIGALVKTAGNGVEKIDKVLGGLVFDAFPSRDYVRHVNSVLNVSAADGEAYYTYVFEVDEAYYRISCGEDCGTCRIGLYDDSDDNGVEISLSAKAIREWVENFERKASGEEGSEGKKYEFTGETKEVEGHTLHRIRAVRKITDPNVSGWEIKVGAPGGWIESEKNLSHDGAAWVDHEACVYGDAEVSGNALVDDDALVAGDAHVYGNAQVTGKAEVYGFAKVYDDALVYEGAEVAGDAQVYGGARVNGEAQVYGDAEVCGDVEVSGKAEVSGNAKVFHNAKVFGNAKVSGDAEVFGNAQVHGNAEVYGFAHVYGDAKVSGDAEVRGTATLQEGRITEGTHGGKPEKSADPETEDTLKHRMAALEGRFDRLSSEMKATVKDIEDIKKKLNM